MVLHIELYLLLTLSVTFTLLKGHSSVTLNWKLYVFMQLSWNFVWSLSTSTRSWIYHYLFLLLSHVFRWDNSHVSWFNKNFVVDLFMDTVSGKFFQLHYYNLALDLQIRTRFYDLDLVSRSQVCQIHKLQIVFRFLYMVMCPRGLTFTWWRCYGLTLT